MEQKRADARAFDIAQAAIGLRTQRIKEKIRSEPGNASRADQWRSIRVRCMPAKMTD